MYWITAILLGLLGSIHCSVMCGPIVLAISSVSQRNKLSFVVLQLTYHLGRIFTYLTIGAIVGLIGKGIGLIGFQQWLSILSGLIILTIYFLPKISKGSFNANPLILRLINLIKKRISPFLKSRRHTSKFMIGFINGFLPCGLVYIAAAGAIATGEPFDSAIFMLFFGIGTAPALLGISIFKTIFISRLKPKNINPVPFLIVIISVFFFIRGLNLGIPYLSPEIGDIYSNEIVNCE